MANSKSTLEDCLVQYAQDMVLTKSEGSLEERLIQFVVSDGDNKQRK